MTELPALEELLQQALEHRWGTAPPHPDTLRDWLWLADQLEGLTWGPAKPQPARSSRQEPNVKDPAVPPLEHSPPDDFRGQPATTSDQPAPWLPTPFPSDPPPTPLPSERMARLTDPNLLPDEASVADALPLQVTELPMLRSPDLLLKALKPLLQKRSHPRWRVLDEERSAESSHERGMPWPEFRPRKVPMVALQIVLDGGLPMVVWEPLARELRRVLAASQAFARVDLIRLDLTRLAARPAAAAGAETTATLLLSDTTGRHWWNGDLLPWLQNQSRHQPLVVLHLLPPRYWEATALQRAEAVTLLNRVELAGNGRYEALRPLPYPWEEPDELTQAAGPTVTLPVVSLDHRALAPWAALAVGDGRARCSGRLLPLEARVSEGSTSSTATAEDQWSVFVQRASPAARQLLLAMATSPLLTLPVMRLMLGTVAPDAFSPQPLAEVLLSGLVRRLSGPEDATVPLAQIQFEVLPDVQSLLHEKLDVRTRHQVLDDVTALLQRHWDRQHDGPSFKALVLGPKDDLKSKHPDLHHIAHLTAAMLDRLPGQAFQDLAAQLRGTTVAPPPPPIWPSTVVFNEVEFETAQLLDVPDLETFEIVTARFESCALQQMTFETAVLAAAGVNRSAGANWGYRESLGDATSLPMLEIPAGSFLMGLPDHEPDRPSDEGPQHTVDLDRFFMSQTPITQAQWRVVAQWQELPGEHWGRELKAEPSAMGGPDADQKPVETVSWHDAMEFCHRLSQRTGRYYTLPSEVQWEYACRAGTTTPFHFGETITPDLANYDANYTYANGPKGEYRKQTTPVGLFPANAWGLQDMHGNVWEWCLDQWHESYAGAPSDGSAWVDSEDEKSGVKRLLRGGSWDYNPRICRSAYRNHFGPVDAYFIIGFRVVCLPQDPSLNT